MARERDIQHVTDLDPSEPSQLPAGWWKRLSGWKLARSRDYVDWQVQLVLLGVVVAMCGYGIWATRGKLGATLTFLGLQLAFIVLVVRPRRSNDLWAGTLWSAWWGMALAVGFAVAVFWFRGPRVWSAAASMLFGSMWIVVPMKYRWAPSLALFMLGLGRLAATA